MGTTRKELASKCCYCTRPQEYKGFGKLVEMKDAGIVLYYHTPDTDDVVIFNSTPCVVILLKMKDRVTKSAEVLPKLDTKRITCTRCNQIVKHAQELLQKAPRIKSNILGICDHCRLKIESHEPCSECEKAIKMFLLAYGMEKKDAKEFIRIWLTSKKGESKIKDYKDMSQYRISRSYSDGDLDASKERLLKTESMFHSEENIPDTAISQIYQQGTQKERFKDVEDASEEYQRAKKGLGAKSKYIPDESDTQTNIEIDGKRSREFADKKGQELKDIDAMKYEQKFKPTDRKTLDSVVKGDQLKEQKQLGADEKLVIKSADKTLPKDITREKDDQLKKLKQLDIDKKRVKESEDKKSPKETIKGKDDQIKKQKQLDMDKKRVKESEDKKSPKETIKGKDDQLKKQKQLDMDKKRVKESEDKKSPKETKEKGDQLRKQMDMDEKRRKEPGDKKSQKETTKDKDDQLKKQLDMDAKRIKGSEDKKSQKETTKEKGDQLKKQIDMDEKRIKEPADKKSQKETTKDKDDQLKKQLDMDAKRIKGSEDKKSQKETTKEKGDPLKKQKQSEMDEKEPKDVADKKETIKGKGSELKTKSQHGKDKGLDSEVKKIQSQLAKEKGDELKKQKQMEMDEKKVKDKANKKAQDLKAQNDADSTNGKKIGSKTKPMESKLDSKKDTIKEKTSTTNLEKDSKAKKLNNEVEFMRMQAQHEREKAEAQKKQQELEKEEARIKELAQKKLQEMMLQQLEENKSQEAVSEKSSSFPDVIIHECRPTEHKIVTGENLALHKPSYKPKKDYGESAQIIPLLFKGNFKVSPIHSPKAVEMTEDIKEKKGKVEDKSKGTMHYALSDRTFIEKGWTMLPTEKVVRKMNVYRMRPAHPEFDWFEHNKSKQLMTYDSGEKLAEFDDNGRGRWYYKNGRLALDYYDAEETNAQQRFVIYSSGEPDERGRTHPITILATFDYLGNGIVFDHAGKIRLKYNQTEGVVLDRSIGPVTHWKWHTLNDPPVLQQVMMDTQMAHKDPVIFKLGDDRKADKVINEGNEDMIAIEFDNFIKEKKQKLTQNFKPFQIKMKALKINQHFSLRVLDQATVYLIFRDGSANFKLNIGMVLDHREIVDTDTAEVGEVANSLERFPARTDSLAALQRSVAFAQHYERTLTERERRTRPTIPCASVDKLLAPTSRPLRPPLRTLPAAASGSEATSYFFKSSRKPPPNIYYDTRLM